MKKISKRGLAVAVACVLIFILFQAFSVAALSNIGWFEEGGEYKMKESGGGKDERASGSGVSILRETANKNTLKISASDKSLLAEYVTSCRSLGLPPLVCVNGIQTSLHMARKMADERDDIVLVDPVFARRGDKLKLGKCGVTPVTPVTSVASRGRSFAPQNPDEVLTIDTFHNPGEKEYGFSHSEIGIRLSDKSKLKKSDMKVCIRGRTHSITRTAATQNSLYVVVDGRLTSPLFKGDTITLGEC